MREATSPLRLIRTLAIALAALYLIACGALYVMQRELLYDPHPLLFSPDAQDIAIPAKGVLLHGWVVNPGKPQALVYFGGKGESLERDVEFFRATVPDCSVYLVPYRGYGPNAGSPTQADLFADALVVYGSARARYPQVSVMGRSLGSGVATWVASQRDVGKLVLVTPYDSVLNIARERYWMFPVSFFMKDPFESWRYATLVKAPVLVVLASDDQVVARPHSDALMARFRTRPEVVVVPHSNHNNLHNGKAYAQAVGQFMRVRDSTRSSQPVLSH